MYPFVDYACLIDALLFTGLSLMLEPLSAWIAQYALNLALTVVALGSYLALRLIIAPVIRRHAA